MSIDKINDKQIATQWSRQDGKSAEQLKNIEHHQNVNAQTAQIREQNKFEAGQDRKDSAAAALGGAVLAGNAASFAGGSFAKTIASAALEAKAGVRSVWSEVQEMGEDVRNSASDMAHKIGVGFTQLSNKILASLNNSKRHEVVTVAGDSSYQRPSQITAAQAAEIRKESLAVLESARADFAASGSFGKDAIKSMAGSAILFAESLANEAQAAGDTIAIQARKAAITAARGLIIAYQGAENGIEKAAELAAKAGEVSIRAGNAINTRDESDLKVMQRTEVELQKQIEAFIAQNPEFKNLALQ